YRASGASRQLRRAGRHGAPRRLRRGADQRQAVLPRRPRQSVARRAEPRAGRTHRRTPSRADATFSLRAGRLLTRTPMSPDAAALLVEFDAAARHAGAHAALAGL